MQCTVFGHQIHIPTDAIKLSRRMEVRILKRYLSVQAGDLLCDIGTGNGYWLREICADARAVGIDIDAAALKLARRSTNGNTIQYVLMNAERLGFSADVFDKILGVCSVEHISDNEAAFSEFARCLKPGGVLALTLDSMIHPSILHEQRRSHADKYSVAHFYSTEYARECLEKVGLKLTDYQYIISSRISNWLYRIVDKSPRIQYPMFPIAYPLMVLADALFGSEEYGWKIAIRAVKE